MTKSLRHRITEDFRYRMAESPRAIRRLAVRWSEDFRPSSTIGGVTQKFWQAIPYYTCAYALELNGVVAHGRRTPSRDFESFVGPLTLVDCSMVLLACTSTLALINLMDSVVAVQPKRFQSLYKLISALNALATAEPAELFAGRYRLNRSTAEWEPHALVVPAHDSGSGTESACEQQNIKCALSRQSVVAARPSVKYIQPSEIYTTVHFVRGLVHDLEADQGAEGSEDAGVVCVGQHSVDLHSRTGYDRSVITR